MCVDNLHMYIINVIKVYLCVDNLHMYIINVIKVW